MDKVLPLLTEGALTARDRQAAATRDAAAAVRQAEVTLERLTGFRAELLARAPGARASADTQSLVDHQRFVARLDEAIAMQLQERGRRLERANTAQQQLIDRQKRLMAFETLSTRRARVRAVKETRRDQRDSDEHAARASRRLNEDSFL